MPSNAETSIRSLARTCALRNLRMPQAQRLFETLYAANAIANADGNVTRAAHDAGVTPPTLHRILRRSRIGESES